MGGLPCVSWMPFTVIPDMVLSLGLGASLKITLQAEIRKLILVGVRPL
jgi:hypothetical protein